MASAPHRVAMVLTPGMPIFEAAVPCEVFGVDRSDLVDPWYEFSIVGLGPRRFELTAGFQFADGQSRDELDRADTLVVPACAAIHDKQPTALVDVVRRAHAAGTRILSICTGAFALADAGILDGRRAATHWLHAPELARRHPGVRVDPDVLYVEDDNVITSAGIVAGIDACLHLVRTDFGAAVAAEVARRLVTPPHRDGGQAQYHRPAAPPVTDQWLAPLLDWLSRHLHEPLTTADLAAHANTSVRTVERRFAAVLGTSPLQWLIQHRVRRAQQLLETTNRPVDRIATDCGFNTPASLRSHFTRIVGVPPTTYRHTFHDRA